MAKYLDENGLLYFWGKIKAKLAAKADASSLATVATSGSFNDLTDKPAGVEVPDKLSAFTDDLGTSPAHTHSQYVEKVNGKGLSTNDYTTAEKNKLAGIAAGATANVGTITGIKMNGASMGTSGEVDLGTVITDVSGKADKTATVSDVTYDSTTKKLRKTINGTTTDVAEIVTRSEWDAMMGPGTTEAIDTFEEIKTFLAGVEDSTLVALKEGIQQWVQDQGYSTAGDMAAITNTEIDTIMAA